MSWAERDAQNCGNIFLIALLFSVRTIIDIIAQEGLFAKPRRHFIGHGDRVIRRWRWHRLYPARRALDRASVSLAAG